MRSEGGNEAKFKKIILSGANVTGEIDLSGASFDGDLVAEALQVGDSLVMRSDGDQSATYKNVLCAGRRLRAGST